MKDNICIADINEAGVVVDHITMDGDSNANSQTAQVKQNTNNGSTQPIQVQRCCRHLSRTIKNTTSATEFSRNMFGTGKNKEKVKNNFAYDLQ